MPKVRRRKTVKNWTAPAPGSRPLVTRADLNAAADLYKRLDDALSIATTLDTAKEINIEFIRDPGRIRHMIPLTHISDPRHAAVIKVFRESVQDEINAVYAALNEIGFSGI